jgi:hypothetical protein
VRQCRADTAFVAPAFDDGRPAWVWVAGDSARAFDVDGFRECDVPTPGDRRRPRTQSSAVPHRWRRLGRSAPVPGRTESRSCRRARIAIGGDIDCLAGTAAFLAVASAGGGEPPSRSSAFFSHTRQSVLFHTAPHLLS